MTVSPTAATRMIGAALSVAKRLRNSRAPFSSTSHWPGVREAENGDVTHFDLPHAMSISHADSRLMVRRTLQHSAGVSGRRSLQCRRFGNTQQGRVSSATSPASCPRRLRTRLHSGRPSSRPACSSPRCRHLHQGSRGAVDAKLVCGSVCWWRLWRWLWWQ